MAAKRPGKQFDTQQASESREKTASSRPNAERSSTLGDAAVITRRAADRLRAGHVWVYRSDVTSVPEDAAGLLRVRDARGALLGTALYSPSSEITLRLISQEEIASEAAWLEILGKRLRSAIGARRDVLARTDTNACRLAFSEADALPGLIADKYGDLVVLQLLTKALDNEAVRIVAASVLKDALHPSVIVERPDARIRELEQLSMPLDAEPLYVRDELDLQVQFLLNGLKFHYDAGAGQKTGAFLDQRENYAAAAEYAHGEALDVCTYQGGFALHLARVCDRVTGIDVSRAALEIAEKNLEANKSAIKAEVDWVEANAFDLLRDWSESGAAYDTIVLDPPAFAKSKRAVEGALRGYKELNLRALKMLRPGGVLVTCSCSHHVSLADFNAVVAAAAGDAGRRVRLIERRGAAADHPVILTIPETEYLKCLICVVE
jgi:23S rRNA (cytosine1962-C5)-methyltransferase